MGRQIWDQYKKEFSDVWIFAKMGQGCHGAFPVLLRDLLSGAELSQGSESDC